MVTTLQAQPGPDRALLPDDFVFSQSTLQIYEDCPRRFWLTYVEQLPWPAVEAAPATAHEQQMVWGDEFHRMVQRAEIGLETATPTGSVDSPLGDWFNAYLEHRPRDLPTEFIETELTLNVPLALSGRFTAAGMPETCRLAAKYDLVAANRGGPAVILDWKTGRQRGDVARLSRRLQTAIYPYVLVEAGNSMPWGPVAPEQVEMRYWFTADPLQTVRLPYSAHQHAANRDRLQRLIGAILDGRKPADFPLVPDTEYNRRFVCGYCTYRSRCNRGIGAQSAADLPDSEALASNEVPSLEFSLSEIEEIAF